MQAPQNNEAMDKLLGKQVAKENEETEEEKENRDTEPCETMKGFLMKQSKKIAGEEGGNILGEMVGGLDYGLKFGKKLFKDTVGKAVPFNNLEKEFFALKNGILYWYVHERARKAKGSIIVKNIEAIEINPKNRMQITMIYEGKLYELESLDSKYNAEKWFNSLVMVKEMGDL
jgi:hypothetical protein